MKRFKNKLDEMQEKKLLKIEHFGMWIAFWGLFAALVIQRILGAELKQVAGEAMILLVVCLYLLVASLKNGIWDRHLKPNLKTNLMVSLCAAVAVAIASVAINFHQGLSFNYLPISFGLIGGFTFLLCFGGLQISASIYKRQHEKLEKETEE